MIRAPNGRGHFRTEAEFRREMQRIDAELAAEEAASGRLSIDAIFARCGFFTDENSDFVDAATGVKVR